MTTTQEWDKKFANEYCKAFGIRYMSEEQILHTAQGARMIDFIRAEKKKSYEEGVEAERGRLHRNLTSMSWQEINETPEAIRVISEILCFLTPTDDITHPTN